ncbi:BLUF domain-containing protein [Siccirubricoccus sp. KC 17139]|uniref:BLUF domain-containing protein n=1 Tax=Siccirubricoccus soli TaxID=2899147 RepID=A0ABT1DA21_9PROT|nr:BLUF domain-containing protein [Siccirubricoccus soli]MCO6418775.1 BLUF domain-containing protein [Siccirubricoccus soli]MCP2684910.1 BLUF domain-containing protein [Siccirubricoccus soli]
MAQVSPLPGAGPGDARHHPAAGEGSDPAQPIHRLVYRSTSAILGTEEQVAAEVAAIVAAARRNNLATGLTGVLVYSGESFTQVLEGPLAALEATYDRISADLRHRQFDLLQFTRAPARSFGNWELAYLTQDALDAFWQDGAMPGGDPTDAANRVLERLTEILRPQPAATG